MRGYNQRSNSSLRSTKCQSNPDPKVFASDSEATQTPKVFASDSEAIQTPEPCPLLQRPCSLYYLLSFKLYCCDISDCNSVKDIFGRISLLIGSTSEKLLRNPLSCILPPSIFYMSS